MPGFQSLSSYSVTQVRTATACPRVFYFDAHAARSTGKAVRTTRLWKSGAGNETTACGSLFHQTIERFNAAAPRDAALAAAVSKATDIDALAGLLLQHVYHRFLKIELLAGKTAEQQRNFLAVLRNYVSEVAAFLWNARLTNRPAAELIEESFGDTRRRVNVTFHVGRDGEPVHVTGILDYLFFDARVGLHRILDYKLTPADVVSDDLMQVCVYALMHHQQHRTEPSAAVLYLHPTRELVSKSWAQIRSERHKVYNLLASMREWERFDETTSTGVKPPGNTSWCASCRWNKKDQCAKRLGDKRDGERLNHWRPSDDRVATPETAAMSMGVESTAKKLTSRSEREPTITVEPTDIASSSDLRNRSRRKPVPRDKAVDGGTSSPQASDAKNVGPKSPETPSSSGEASEVARTLSDEHLVLGRCLPSGSWVSYAAKHLRTHTAVVGAAGSGKTWMAKAIVEEAVRLGVPVLAIDPQGDLVQFLSHRAEADLTDDLKPLGRTFRDRVETRIFTPGTSHATRLSLSPIRMPTDADLTHVSNDARRGEELQSLLAGCAGNIVDLADLGGETESQRTLVLKILESLRRQGVGTVGLNDVIASLTAPDSCGIENADWMLRKSDRDKLARKLFALLEGPSSNLFKGGRPLDLADLAQPTNEGRVPLNIIYLNALASDREKQFFVAMLAEEVYRWMLTSPSKGRLPSLLFYIDEARDFMPAGMKSPPAKASLLRLFTQGRKFGVGCLLCTQSPRSVDYNAFGNCSTKLIGRLEAAQDVERVEEWFTTSGAKPRWVVDRKGAEPGTFVARWPEMPESMEGASFKSRSLFTRHGGAWSPEQLEAAWSRIANSHVTD